MASVRRVDITIGNDLKSVAIKRHHKAKKISLRVNAYGDISVTIPKYVPYRAGKAFLLDNLNWLEDKASHLSYLSHNSRQARDQFLSNKEKALALVLKRAAFYNREYKFKYHQIKIKNQKTRWGSCSSKKNLNFNWRIIELPTQLQDYIIVHELCHLKHMNHSKEFWREVSKTMPDYYTIKKQLAKLTVADVEVRE